MKAPDDMTHPDKPELEAIADAAADRAVARMLIGLGINAADPISVQQDFSRLRALRALTEDEEFQLDLAHLRQWRLAVGSVRNVSMRTGVTIVITGLGALIMMGLKGWFH